MTGSNETIILSQYIYDNNIFYSTNLRETDFNEAENRKIYIAIKQILEDGNVADLVTISKHNKTITPSYLAEISSIYPTKHNYKLNANKVKEDSIRYHLSELPAHITDLVKHKSIPNSEILEEIEKLLVNITTRNLKDKIYKVSDLISPFMDELERRHKSGGNIPGIKTGFKTLDDKIGGFQDRRYYIIGGRPSDGKTALLGNMAIHSAIVEKVHTGIISAESSRFELLNRFYASLGKINSRSIQFGMFKNSEFATLTEVSEKLYDSNLFIHDAPNLQLQELKSQCRRMVSVHKVRIIFIDYIGIIQNRSNIPRHEQILEISLELKQLARELDIPIVVLAQIGRKADDRLPKKTDLAETSQLERDADTVVLIHHERDDDKKIKSSIFIIDKNRDGELAVIDVNFAGHYAQFMECRK